MSDKPCNTCAHFDPIVKGDGKRPTNHGWCAVKSKYPAVEMPGQTFPPGVARVEPGELAQPHIVEAKSIVRHCQQYKAKPGSKK